MPDQTVPVPDTLPSPLSYDWFDRWCASKEDAERRFTIDVPRRDPDVGATLTIRAGSYDELVTHGYRLHATISEDEFADNLPFIQALHDLAHTATDGGKRNVTLDVRVATDTASESYALLAREVC